MRALTTRTSSKRHLLLAGVSFVSLLASTSAHAGDILRSNTTAAPITASAASQAAAQQAAMAAQRAQETLSRTTQALQAMQAAQSAAHAIALSGPSSVPNGLVAGGLQVVSNPVAAVQDATGLNTWQGAEAPTQTTDGSGHISVTVKQDSSRAILSWQSFNVGKDTTLTYDQQGNADWVALNRVVGADVSPSQILGSIKAGGTVMVLNQNGIIFGGSSQINVNSLIATSLDVGRAIDSSNHALTIAQRNQEFLDNGLLGYADANRTSGSNISAYPTFSVDATNGSSGLAYQNVGAVTVQDGAQIASGDAGYVLLAAPTVENAGHLSANSGQIILAGADQLTLIRATGAAGSIDADVRGYVPVLGNQLHRTESVVNDKTGLMESTDGSIILAGFDAAIADGGLFASTSVSRNGTVEISAPNIQVAPGAIIGISPDDNGATIPQDATSLESFRPSAVTIGNLNSRDISAPDQSALIEIGSNALIYAPSANVTLGALPGASTYNGSSATSRIFIDDGVIIDASGLKDVEIPASRNEIKIGPLKNNELADSPQYKDSFLNGATVYVDPRLSGVRSDGIAWIGSPLIDAASYEQQVGVSASELMTKGGNVILGTDSFNGTGVASGAPNIVVKSSATIDISGGWVTYQAGPVHTTQLITSDGRVVDISNASLDDVYVGIYNGFTVNHSRWGVTESFSDALGSGEYYAQSYTEGRDAGSLTLKSSAVAMDGTVFAQAFPGVRQTQDSQVGTNTGIVYGDSRALQAAPSQLPAGGLLLVQAQSQLVGSDDIYTGGADILIEAAVDHDASTNGVVYGQTLQVASGTVSVPARDPLSYFSATQLGTIKLSDALLSNSGLAQVELATSGAVTVAQNANVSLTPGGAFDVMAGRKITIDGGIFVPSGSISLATFNSTAISAGGSVFSSVSATAGDFDVVINGILSAGGRWINDLGLNAADQEGSAWMDGGTITIYVAPRISTSTMVSVASGGSPADDAPAVSSDLSGSILVNSGSLLDVSGGGRVDRYGNLDMSAKGGDLNLYNETSYFEIADWGTGIEGSFSGFRVGGLSYTGNGGTSGYVPVNPDQINARVSIDPNAIRAQGFGGGGTFTLVTPAISLSDDGPANATNLPLDFFSSAGFADYHITSYKTDLIANPFNNGLGGTDALLAVQSLTIGQGQVLNLTQSMLPNVLDQAQAASLRALPSGGDVFSMVMPDVPADAWDRKPVNLTLNGLLELDVAPGGSIVGEAGASLTVDKLLNQGVIRLPGGSITQQEILPTLYTKDGALGVHALSDIFSVDADGSINENAASRYASSLTNAQLAGADSPAGSTHPIYLVDTLDADQGIVLAPGSVTDLSGASIRDPYALDRVTGQALMTGRIVAGGTLTTLPGAAMPGTPIYQPHLLSPYQLADQIGSSSINNGITTTVLDVARAGRSLVVAPGAVLDISGASDVYDEPAVASSVGLVSNRYVATPVWSDAGALQAEAGVTLTGATILAHGGAPEADGGTLTFLDPVLVQHDTATPVVNQISADMIANSGFTTLVALGSVQGDGDVTIGLDRAFFLEDRPVIDDGRAIDPDTQVPTIRSNGGTLTINAPLISFDSNFDTIASPSHGTVASGSVVFNAATINIAGALLTDRSVADVSFNATGDIRLTGVQPWQQTFYPTASLEQSLNGLVAGTGNLTFRAGQIYPTTGSTFSLLSAGAGASIVFARSTNAVPDAPYSAGGNLTVQAANIVQGGIIRVPLGTLTLGGNTVVSPSGNLFAPVTDTLTLAPGSVTSVSANGLIIPYGTTTDQKEWYFAPTDADPLTAPPQKLLSLGGGAIAIQSGATVDISGSGDISAYEFVPGTGGSRDVLDQKNPDSFTSNNGYQYSDGRQIYAIVPGLSDAPVAAYDPIYGSGYSLWSGSAAGMRVYLNGGSGLASGWYTLLPAKYALLPGGMRVVEETGAQGIVGASARTLLDGSLIVSGYYGDALSGSAQSQTRLFNVQSQSVITKESDIVQTTANNYFAQLADHGGLNAPPLPVDAGRLVLTPGATLAVDSAVATSAGTGGRGAEVDLSGNAVDILAVVPANAPADGVVRVTASSLTNLNADSLLVGGVRTNNADGSTSIDVTAGYILVQNTQDTPLSAHEVVLAASSGITVANGAEIIASGALSDPRDGAYDIGSGSISGSGALLRVANGPERLVVRTDSTDAAALAVGAATLSGTSVAFDSSGADTLDPNLVIQNAKYVSIGAPRIGFGADPTTYDGLVVTRVLESLLTQGGAQLTLRSQSSIDFAGGDYDFNDVRFDAAALSGLDGGDVALHGNTISLGNVGADGLVCNTCGAGSGALSIVANDIVFTGGALATKASLLAGNAAVTVAAEVTVTLPTGTLVGIGLALAGPTQVVVPVGTPLTLLTGTGLVQPAGAGGTVSSGTIVTPSKDAPLSLPPTGSYYFPNGFNWCGANSCGSEVANYYSLTATTQTVLPAGSQVALNTSAPVTLTQFFGGGVTLSAVNGIFAQGAASVLDVGPAPLVIHSPYIGDRAVSAAAGSSAIIPDLLLASTGSVRIDNPGAPPSTEIAGIAGASVTIDGGSVSVSGTAIRATAGTVAINASSDIALSGAATVRAPGYTATFGDAADPTSQDAPGGEVVLSSQGGNIALGDAILSVGGGNGNAGKLVLSAPAGAIDFGNAMLDGTAGAGGAGGSFSLDVLGSVDLANLSSKVTADGFTGGFSVHSGMGDLILAAGENLRASTVTLTADGGMIDLAGGIDTSGINGGDVALYGRNGVMLESTARINASATGYAADDTRQATGGNVTLGTDFIASSSQADGSVGGTSGAIAVASGAAIDVSAKRPGDRLVAYYANDVKYYDYVQGDTGGTVTFRAPVIASSGVDTVNVAIADAASIVGASAIDLIGFKRWDLGVVANSGLYAGVTLTGGTVTLNVATDLDTANSDGSLTAVGGINFLGDKGVGGVSTLVDFVQNYDVSTAYGNLGGLAAQANFHAKPGVDLTFAGNITLASNWNLGAGTVRQDAAIANGVMGMQGSQTYVVPGQEAELLADYTSFTYRTGASPTGEAPEISLRAQGNLHLAGSITDGFFQFGDQYDPQYQTALLSAGAPSSTYILTVPIALNLPDNSAGPWASAADMFNFCFVGSGCPDNAIAYNFSNPSYVLSTGSTSGPLHIPYSALGNSAAAIGSGQGGNGDPLGSAVVFPLLPGNRSVNSASFNLTAGADLVETPAGLPSVNPLGLNMAVHADVVIDGEHQESLTVTSGGVSSGIFLQIGSPSGTQYVSAADWLAGINGAFTGQDSDSGVEIDGGGSNLSGAIDQFAADHPDMVFADTADGFSDFTRDGMALFLTNYLPAVEAAYIRESNPQPPSSSGQSSSKIVIMNPQALVRTGTGTIQVAASGNVDLTNGARTDQTTYRSGVPFGTAQAGGAAIYTVGHPLTVGTGTAVDPITGQTVSVDFATAMPTTSNLASASSYDYGTGTQGIAGVVVADPVYLAGGGNVDVIAGGDVLGRRDAVLAGDIALQANPFAWVGGVDEPWRVGAVGSTTTAAINPQLFVEGIGTLGGGNISIAAGHNVSDVSVIATDSMLTATATQAASQTKALAAFGGGNVTVTAGADILGGRLDVASGTADIVAGHDIASAGSIAISLVGSIGQQTIDNLLRVRMTDATIDVSAGGDIDLQGVAALGPLQNYSGSGLDQQLNNMNALGLYSSHASLSLIADGSVKVVNGNDNLLTAATSKSVTNLVQNAVYPGTFKASALSGNLDIVTGTSGSASAVLLVPSPVGQLSLLSGGDIAPATVAMLDADPGILPGVFSLFSFGVGAQTGISWVFPTVFPGASDSVLQEQHRAVATHADDENPVRIAADNDIGSSGGGLILSVPKSARIGAGRDIINMMFFGQNLTASDITRVVAGRDITATSVLTAPVVGFNPSIVLGTPEAALQGNTFVIGGPGSFVLQAGRDIGPFLNSATITAVRGSTTHTSAVESYGGGILSVGNEWNPWLPEQGADVSVLFGVAGGVDYDAFREAYLDPANLASMPDYLFGQKTVSTMSGTISSNVTVADRSDPVYGTTLVQWMQANDAPGLIAAYGTTDVNYTQAYAIFATLPGLNQQTFLNKIYFQELEATDNPVSPSYHQYARGYTAVNTLFPPSDGYTQNALNGGANGATTPVLTGDLDLRLATIQTARGGDITIMGPGGRVIAGSTVRTDAQAARRTYDGGRLFAGNDDGANIVSPLPAAISTIPPGFEGVLTLRGGNISTFTDGDFLLNQSRLFTEQGGDILMWSSNANLNAGQGPKTSANFPPVVLRISQDLYSEEDESGNTTGAGIAALQVSPDTPPSAVYLIAPRGTVDFGDAGVRVSGDLFVAALTVANADNVQVGGHAFGVPQAPTVNTGALSAASNAAAAVSKTAMTPVGQGGATDLPSIITVEVLGYGGSNADEQDDTNLPRKQRK